MGAPESAGGALGAGDRPGGVRLSTLCVCVYMYIYIYTYMCVCVSVAILAQEKAVAKVDTEDILYRHPPIVAKRMAVKDIYCVDLIWGQMVAWDVLDILTFALWVAVYLPHMEDPASFGIIGGLFVVLPGVYLIYFQYGGLDKVNKVANSARAANCGTAYAMEIGLVTSVDWQIQEMQKAPSWKNQMKILREGPEPIMREGMEAVVREVAEAWVNEWKNALYVEVLYDLLQFCVIGWLLEFAPLKEESFPFRLLVDFLSMATTFIDILIIKGPSAFQACRDPMSAYDQLQENLQ